MVIHKITDWSTANKNFNLDELSCMDLVLTLCHYFTQEMIFLELIFMGNGENHK